MFAVGENTNSERKILFPFLIYLLKQAFIIFTE